MAHKGQKTKVGQDKSEIVADVPKACADETAAVEFLEKLRWGDSPCCPRCGDTDVYQMRDSRTGGRNARYLWRCRGCKKQYTVRIGTVFEDSRIPLRHWCYAFWAACASKKGVSALQIKRQTGLTYKSALFMMHRIRFAMAPANDQDGGKLTGIVEADETFIGGKPRYHEPRVPKKFRTKKMNTGHHRKQPVFGALERGGRVRARVIADVTGANLRAAVEEHIDKSAHLVTDENTGYIAVGKEYQSHETVCHSRREYVREGVTTNSIESFWAILKRGVMGTFHNISRKHLQRYLDEFEYRYNTRKVDDGERLALAIRGANGKRLTYQDMV